MKVDLKNQYTNQPRQWRVELNVSEFSQIMTFIKPIITVFGPNVTMSDPNYAVLIPNGRVLQKMAVLNSNKTVCVLIRPSRREASTGGPVTLWVCCLSVPIV